MGRDLPPCPDFDSFYRAVNGRDPFPWQSRLAKQVKSGDWPSLIGVPTGLGKTSCLEVALWALAAQADLESEERTAPTRVWWVVNRRLLVDDTFGHAQKMAERLKNATEGILYQCAERLRYLSASRDDSKSDPLQIVRLRGGAGVDRPASPAQPAVICATVPMYGSRVLFRGYGSSRSTRPIDAALAYADSLVVCDEAHLAKHLMGLFEQLSEMDGGTEGPVLPGGRDRPKVIALTATGDLEHSRFDLDGADFDHKVIRQRHFTPKPVKVVALASPTKTEKSIAKHLAREVKTLLAGKPGSSCLVFVNTPTTARAVVHQLKTAPYMRELEHPSVVMLTGRMREREADGAREAVLNVRTGMRAGRQSGERDRHLIVVATQTLEVGADLDARYLVTEACGVRALTQRLGRLNRLGEHENPLGVYVHIPPTRGQNPQWPVYGEEPNLVLECLRAAAPINQDEDTVDLSPARLAGGVLGSPGDDPGRAPVVSFGLLHEWTQSTAETPGEAPVEPFFSGLSEPHRGVQIIWRAHLPDSDQRIWPLPSDGEAIEVSIGEAREGLSDVTALLRRVTPDGTVDTVDQTVEGIPLLSPGWTVVVQSVAGKMDEYGWNPEASEPVVDLSILSHGLPLDIKAFRALYPRDVPIDEEAILDAVDERKDGEPVDRKSRREAAERLLEALSGAPPPGYDLSEWEALITNLNPQPQLARTEVPRLRRRSQNWGSVRLDASDELSAAQSKKVGLDQHGIETMTFAENYANAIGLNGTLVSLLGRAGQWHDIGKADPRFQDWLRAAGPPGSELLAKSDTPRHQWARFRARAGWPKGGRHEALSGRLVLARLSNNSNGCTLDQADLLVHLVVSHHGHGRPMVTPVMDPTVTEEVAWAFNGDHVAVDGDLSRSDWKQPGRFARLNSLYGYWGLALLETIVRQADWTASGSGAVR